MLPLHLGMLHANGAFKRARLRKFKKFFFLIRLPLAEKKMDFPTGRHDQMSAALGQFLYGVVG